jgi:hypothetical protein
MRLQTLMMSGIIPFNFGMNYEDCLKFYDKHHDKLPDLCPSDPRSWSQDLVDKVNQKAKDEDELVGRLMNLPKDEFNAEVERLSAQREEQNES